jgi:RNA polymerase sigma-70 factor (ECF subfamily)
MVEKTARDDVIDVKAIKARDRTELGRMVDRFSPGIFRLALRMLGNEQDAEDILQETFIKALKSLDGFEERSTLSTWLYRIAMNEALMALRKHRIPTVSIDEEKDDDEGPDGPREIVDWCCLPEEELLGSETRKFLDKAIQKLSPALRAVFVLRDMQGLSVNETAEALNISENAVKTRLLRARLKLREELSAYFGRRME